MYNHRQTCCSELVEKSSRFQRRKCPLKWRPNLDNLELRHCGQKFNDWFGRKVLGICWTDDQNSEKLVLELWLDEKCKNFWKKYDIQSRLNARSKLHPMWPKIMAKSWQFRGHKLGKKRSTEFDVELSEKLHSLPTLSWLKRPQLDLEVELPKPLRKSRSGRTKNIFLKSII